MTFTFTRLPSQQISIALREPVTPYPISIVESRWNRRWDQLRQIGGILLVVGVVFSCFGGTRMTFSGPLDMIGALIAVITSVSLFGLVIAGLIGLPAALRAVRISGQIAAERERGTYDLLSTSALGAFGLHWWIARHISMPRKASAPQRRTRFWLLVIACIVGILFLLGFFNSLFISGWESLRGLAYLITSVYAVWVYFRQNETAASVIGMLIPAYVEKRFEARFWTLSAYVLYQIGTIGLLVVVGFYLVPTQGGRWGSPSVGDVLVILLRLALLVGSRELIIMWMWRHLRWRLNGHVEELDLLSRLRL
jgi:hypothetical protein